VKAITTTMNVADEGFISEIFLNHLFSEKDIDEACLLDRFVISNFLFLNQVFRTSLAVPARHFFGISLKIIFPRNL
jgi:hypothetical protein